jgi:pimeloyl-ACP methyl ester carboxylesterase
MTYAITRDGIKLYFEETGAGTPIVFVHEFAGDYRSWEPQVRFFSRYYRCIAFNARGYPPSDVPGDQSVYSQQHACDDVIAVMDHLGIGKAHIVGLSMGGFATVHVGIAYPQRTLSLVIAGCGYGSEPTQKARFRSESETVAYNIEQHGGKYLAEQYSLGPARVQLQNKDPRAWREFADQLAQHSPQGSALTQRGVQAQRPSLWELKESIMNIDVPTLIVTGDEDEPCLEASLFLKRQIMTSALLVLPRTGHTLNIEEPDAFNRAISEFYLAQASGRWQKRDPRSVTTNITVADSSASS